MGLFVTIVAAAAGIAAMPVGAASPSDPPRIVVVGHGTIRTDPDVAMLSFSIRGEGATSDAAATELVRKRTAIANGLAGLLGDASALHTGDLSIREARDKACDRDDEQPRLSTGPCAIRGYVASIDASLRISPVTRAGTALSLASRLGASNPVLNDFGLADPGDAQRRAEAAAIDDAHRRAAGIATAAGSRLGALLSVEDSAARGRDAMDIVVTANRRTDAPPEATPPVVIDLKPGPITTSATLTVTYAVAR